MKNFKATASYTSNIDKDYFKDKKIINNKFMENIKTFLQGKKTYIQGAVALFVIGLWMIGFVDAEIATKILVMLGFGSVISLKAGLDRDKQSE